MTLIEVPSKILSKVLLKALCAGILTMLAIFAAAQDKKEQEELRLALDAHIQALSDVNEELSKYESKLTQLDDELLAAKAALETSLQGVKQQTAVYEAEPVSANKRTLDRAKSTHVLAERKLTSLQSRYDFSLSKKNEALASILALENDIAANEKRQAQLVEEIAIQERARIEAEKRAKALAAKRLAEQKALAAKRLAEQKALEAKRLAEQKALLESNAGAAELSTENKSEVANSSAIESDSPINAGLASIKAVMEEFGAYLASGVRKRGDIRLANAYSDINGKFSLTHLGGEIYFGEINLDSGRHLISVGENMYRVSVADEDTGKLYSVYFDNRGRYEKKLLVFKSELNLSEKVKN